MLELEDRMGKVGCTGPIFAIFLMILISESKYKPIPDTDILTVTSSQLLSLQSPTLSYPVL